MNNNSISVLVDDVPPRALSLLELNKNERILFHKKIGLIPFFINERQEARTNLFITTDQIAILDYYRFPIRFYNGCTKKDSIPLASIIRIECRMNKRYLVEQPELRIVAASGQYEMVFKRKHIKVIHALCDMLKQLVPTIEINIDLPEPNQRQGLFS